MNYKQIKRLLLTLINISVCAQDQLGEYSPAAAARCDVEFIMRTIQDHHPGIYNKKDLDFKKTLQASYEEAWLISASVQEKTHHIAVLENFLRSFNDSHTQLCLAEPFVQDENDITHSEPFSISAIANDIAWVRIPTFNPQDSQLTPLIKELPTIRSKKCIVFDMRGNGGGNSIWADKVVESLFGSSYARMKRHQKERALVIDWRASEGNVAYVDSLKELVLYQCGIESQEYSWISTIHEGMKNSLAQKKPYFRERETKSEMAKEKAGVPHNRCLATIVVVVDEKCASACLDFIDYLKAINEQTILLGKPTGADSLYMEVRTFELPSKIGTITVPIKVYRKRVRGHNQRYIPDVSYHGDLSDTLQLQKLVMDTLSSMKQPDLFCKF